MENVNGSENGSHKKNGNGRFVPGDPRCKGGPGRKPLADSFGDVMRSLLIAPGPVSLLPYNSKTHADHTAAQVLARDMLVKAHNGDATCMKLIADRIWPAVQINANAEVDKITGSDIVNRISEALKSSGARESPAGAD